MIDKGIININKPCATCGLTVKPTEWFIFCTHHLVREHIECAYSSLARSKHKKCKRIEKNYPTDVFGEEKKFEWKETSVKEFVIIDKRKEKKRNVVEKV